MKDIFPEIFLQFINILDIEDFIKLCKINQHYYKICKNNKQYIAKKLLEKYNVDYNDSRNFIYIANNARKNDYISSQTDYVSILRLYYNFYKYTDINIRRNLEGTAHNNKNSINFHLRKKISSFPIYPNLVRLSISDNLLTTFPIQPSLEDLHIQGNRLTSFPIQPKLKKLLIYDNQLTSFPIQPELIYLHIYRNKLISFPKQPKLQTLLISDNKLTLFNIQPELLHLDISNNNLTSIPQQPKLIQLIS